MWETAVRKTEVRDSGLIVRVGGLPLECLPGGTVLLIAGGPVEGWASIVIVRGLRRVSGHSPLPQRSPEAAGVPAAEEMPEVLSPESIDSIRTEVALCRSRCWARPESMRHRSRDERRYLLLRVTPVEFRHFSAEELPSPAFPAGEPLCRGGSRSPSWNRPAWNPES